MAFEEGYTQIFGSANLALRGEGRRVHLSLDEATGECSSPVCAISL
jgi:xyloglucan:xyloglucosyl transferase